MFSVEWWFHLDLLQSPHSSPFSILPRILYLSVFIHFIISPNSYPIPSIMISQEPNHHPIQSFSTPIFTRIIKVAVNWLCKKWNPQQSPPRIISLYSTHPRNWATPLRFSSFSLYLYKNYLHRSRLLFDVLCCGRCVSYIWNDFI